MREAGERSAVKGDGGHRWLGYRPVIGDGFVAVCSCGWQSPSQRTAGLAGALLDAHREAARAASPGGGDGRREVVSSADADSDRPDA